MATVKQCDRCGSLKELCFYSEVVLPKLVYDATKTSALQTFLADLCAPCFDEFGEVLRLWWERGLSK